MTTARRATLAASLVAAAAAGLGCHSNGLSSCRKDVDCGPGYGCMGEICLPRSARRPGPWAVEVAPAPESSLAFREYPEFAFTAEGNVLQVDVKATVAGTIEREETEMDPSMPAGLRVLVLLPSLIATRKNFQLETDGSITSPGGPVEFSLGVPTLALGSAAKVWLRPSAPLDQTLPPWLVPITLEGSLQIKPLIAADLVFIEGVLETVTGDPVSTYVARALLADQVISNRAATDKAGRFKLKIPRALTNLGSLDGVQLELSAADPAAALPKVVVRTLTLNKLNIGTIRLPAFAQAEIFNVPVLAADTGNPVPAATVRFRTALPGAANGEAYYQREAQTNREGTAQIALIPGIGGATQDYSVTVTPGPNSRSAARCVPTYGVAASAPGARVSASLALSAKVELPGQVFRFDGQPLENVRITATREDTQAALCGADVASQPTTGLSGTAGAYRLLLEPGRYRFEFSPPLGSPSPRFVERGVVVDGKAAHNAILPPAILIDGVVLAPDGTEVPQCEIRVFRPEAGTDLELRGRARTSDDGRFRLVLPDNTSE